MKIKIFIVFCSPGGSTRHVAEVIKSTFSQHNADTVVLDLGKGDDSHEILESIKSAGENACLFIGSPVYRDVAVPPVMKFIEALPESTGAFSVPFVTWGEACSGVALWQMGDALTKKGFKLIGAAKVLAVHSMMWLAEKPAGKGHPDENDDLRVRELADNLYGRLDSGNSQVLSPDVLDYQPDERSLEMKKKIETPWMIVPKQVNEETCTQCGICEEECPVDAVGLNPYPEFNKSCFDCFNCIRLCPENAIEPAIGMKDIEAHIRDRVKTIQEKPLTQIFL